ncbi:MAG TPA: sulfatase-like hydrolase/transferase, partial [Vicinamibacterales bacterium]|nr:sulfatase-like hydrolase/transferase [Vicinamibacterales bacterium]
GPRRGPPRAREAVKKKKARSSRPIAIPLMLAAAVVVVAAVFLARSRSAQADLHPIPGQNVLLITIDTLRADALSCEGGPARTPTLDGLAASGVRFDFAHAHAVITLPSHTSILTGLYPYQHGVRENSGYRLEPNSRTAATLFKKAGYATAAFVSAFPVHSRFGLNQGFDVYDDRFGETRAPTEFVLPERPASEVVPLARTWIAARTRSNERWFVWVHVFDPHSPYRPPPPFDAEYAGRPYYGEVAAADAALGPLIDDVRAAGKPTLVVATGDHGEALGDHGEQTHGLFAYEPTLHIPLIVAEIGNGDKKPQEVSNVAARHVDILPTVLEAAGQPVPPDLPGRSLLSAEERNGARGLFGARGFSRAIPRQSYFEAMAAMLNRGWAPLTGGLVDREKFIDLPIAERYDLASDATESVNLAGRSPDRDRVLAAALRGFNAPLPGARRTEDPDAVARLRALGYTSGSAPIKTRYTEADDPKNLVQIDQMVHRGVEAYSTGRMDEAIGLYRGIIAKRPDMAIAYRHLAFVEWERGDVPAAISVLDQAIKAGVTGAPVVTQLGSYLTDSGRAAEAIRMLEPLAPAKDVDPDTLNALGIAYARGGRVADATQTFERALALDSASAIPLENLGILALQRNDLDAAARLFNRAVEVDPHSSQAHADLGVVAVKRGDHRTATDEWRRAVELDPTNFDALYNLGTTLARDGQMEAARPYLEQFVRSAPAAFYEKDLRDVSALLQSRR